MGTAPSAGEALTALGRGGVLEQLQATPGCVVWRLGGGEDALFDALGALMEGPGPVAIDPGGSPTERHDAPALTIVGDGGHGAGSGLEPWLERAFELGCPYVYARRLTQRQARAEPVDRWYWRYDMTVADGQRLTLGEVRRAAAPACQNRYRHTVGWRRLLPIASPA